MYHFALGSPVEISHFIKKMSSKDIQASTIQGYLYNGHEPSKIPFRMVTSTSDEIPIMVTVSTEHTDSKLHLNSRLDVTHTDFTIYHPPLSEKVGYTRRIGIRNEYEEVVFEYFNNTDAIRKKGVYYTQNTIDTFSIIPILQQLSSFKEATLLSADLSVQHMGIKVPILIQRAGNNELNNALSQYTIHSDLKKMLEKLSMPIVLYTIKVTGWQGFLYNHRHYYVYQASAPYAYIGHWGGPDKLNIFSFVKTP